MGNGNSKTIEVGRKIEDAIRFDIDRVEFDGDMSSYLEKVKPEIERINHSIFYTTERVVDPFSGTFTETLHNLPSFSDSSHHPHHPHQPANSRTAVYSNSSDIKTVVIIKPLDKLKEVKKINWEEAIEKANRLRSS